MSCYFSKIVDMTFDEAIDKTTEALAKEGFGHAFQSLDPRSSG